MTSIYNFIYELEYCLGVSDIPAILLGIIAAHLTIMITVAVALFCDRHEFETLDRFVILDNVVGAKKLIVSLCMFFITLLLWNMPFYMVRIFALALFFISMYTLFCILERSYRWMKGNKHALRIEYLKHLSINNKDHEEAWRSVWRTEHINQQNEREYIAVYLSVLDRFLERRNNES